MSELVTGASGWEDPGAMVGAVYAGGRPHKVIRASAGSGKTFQLTTRYLRLLRHHGAPETMLATTFTRKAAGEILGRILGRLAAAAEDDGERKRLSEALAGPPLRRSDCRAMLGRLARSLDRIAISTIDSFFNRMAQGFRYELDMPINPRLVDESHPLAAQCRAQAIEAVLADDDLATMLNLLRRLHHDAADRSVTEAIDDIVCDHYETYRQAPNESIWSRLEVSAALDAAGLRAAQEALASAADQLPDDRRARPAFEKNLECAVRQDWDGFLGGGLAKVVASGKDSYYGKPLPGVLYGALKTLTDHAQAMGVNLVAMQTAATFELLRRFDQHYDRLRRQQRILLFSDLTHKLARLLPELGDEVLADVYYRLDSRVSHLMLDEFQDTSIDQWAVLRPFAEEITSYSDGSRSFFCVGDVKQAIYGWRGGCASLFDEVEAMVGGAEGLSKSWRSSKVVLDAVNTVFSTLETNVIVDGNRAAARRWSAAFEAHDAAKDLPGYVELITSKPEEDAASSSGRDEEGEDQERFGSHEAFAADRIQAIHAAAPGKTIGVLVATNAMVNLMLYELRRQGLSASGEAGNAVTDSPAVAAVLAALTLADHPGHSAAAFHVANSPMGEVVGLASPHPGDAARVAAEIRRSLLTQGYAATLSGWVRVLAASCGERNLTRLLQLVELAEQYEPLESLRPGRFVSLVETTRVEEPSSALIRVMTVHAAKGLEFDAVVLPQLDRAFFNRPPLLVDREEPLAPIRAVYRCPRQSVREQMPQLERAFEAWQDAQRQEDLCSLYVAMTRAKHALHMIVRPLEAKKRGGLKAAGWTSPSFASLLRRALRRGDDESFEGGERLYRDGDSGWAGRVASAAAPPAPAPSGRLRVVLAQPRADERRAWASVTPSSLHGGGRVKAAELLRLDDGDGFAAGRAVHACLEAVGFVDDEAGLPEDEVFREIARREGLASREAGELVGRLRESLNRPQVREALCRHGAAELWRERSFAVRLDGALLHGQFDRVAICRDAQTGKATRATLLDFKSDRVTGAGLEARARHYHPQLEAYRSALALMLRLEAAKIDARIVFLHAGEVYRVGLPTRMNTRGGAG